MVTRGAALRALRHLIILGFDAFATALALQSAVYLRFEGSVPPDWRSVATAALAPLILVRLLSGIVGRVHWWSFRMSGLAEAVRLVASMAAGTVVFVALFRFAWGFTLPKSVIALEFFFTLTLMGAFRFAPRLAAGWYAEQLRAHRAGAQRTVIVGAGSAGDLLLRDLLRSTDHGYNVVGFVDDDVAKIGTSLGGKPVLGKLGELRDIIARHEVSMVMLAIPRLAAKRIREILDLCSEQKASFKLIPASFTYLDGRITAAMLHDLSPEDLLPRDEVAFDRAEIRRLVQGKRVLITGGGGTIGGEIASQVTEYGAEMVVLVDMNENEMYLRARQLREQHPNTPIRTEVGNVRDGSRLRHIGLQYRPEYIFHAAAHKHVPLMEEVPEEAVKNNILGTLNVAQMADACAAERLVFISTDKAVRPSSVMGASKRVGELVVRDFARSSRTRMTAVRFGNVLGSAGSVVPIFKQQIERGGPVTVTDPDCTRYFMTIYEAVGLVLVAGLGGYGDLCVLQMGEPIRIADLARHMVTMAGYIPGREIAITYTGLRPGEKLHEELLTEEEEHTHSVRNHILVAKSPPPPSDLQDRIDELTALAEAGDRQGILLALRGIVPTYQVASNVALVGEADEGATLRAGGNGLPLRRQAPSSNGHATPVP